jgi:hypothetical protein
MHPAVELPETVQSFIKASRRKFFQRHFDRLAAQGQPDTDGGTESGGSYAHIVKTFIGTGYQI